MTDLTTFDFRGHPVRTAGTFEAPLFRASDVCDVLTIGQASVACNRLDPEDVHEVAEKQPKVNSGGAAEKRRCGGRKALYVTESGLYELIIGSNKPEARSFKRWIVTEVLPAIRKRGYYSLLDEAIAKERNRLLAAHFTELPGPAVPLFSDLIDALLRRFGWCPTKRQRTRRSPAAPPWARQLAKWVYDWAIRVDGQQQYRRVKNPAPPGGSPKYPDHSMFAGATKDAVREVCRTGVHFATSAASWEDWKVRMEIAFGTKALQMPIMVPMLAPPPNSNDDGEAAE